MKDAKPPSQQAWSDGSAICPPTIHRIMTLVGKRLPFCFNVIKQVNMFSTWSVPLLNGSLIGEANDFPSQLDLAKYQLSSILIQASLSGDWCLISWFFKSYQYTHRPFIGSNPWSANDSLLTSISLDMAWLHARCMGSSSIHPTNY